MREEVKLFFNKIGDKISRSQTYKIFSRKRKKLMNRIQTALVDFFDAVSPILIFMCIKTPDSDSSSGHNNKIENGNSIQSMKGWVATINS